MNWQKIKKHDWSITVICLLLMILGLLVIFSTTYNVTDSTLGAGSLPKQIVFIIGGFFLYFFILSIDFSWFENRSIVKVIYLVTLALLIYVKFFGTTIAGTNRWIDIGFFNLQPSEYAKITVILVTAALFAGKENLPYLSGLSRKKKPALLGAIPEWLSIFRINPEQIGYLKILATNVLLIAPIVILTLIQPSLGNAMIISLIWLLTMVVLFPDQKKFALYLVYFALAGLVLASFIGLQKNAEDFVLYQQSEPNFILAGIAGIALIALAFFTRTKAWHLVAIFILIVITVGGAVLTWDNVLTNYQKTRVNTFLAGPESDPQGAGYQVIQSKIAIGSGMLAGRGFLEGTQSSLHVLTQASTDFVFASFAEQFGFLGTIIVLVLYSALILRVIRAGIDANTPFAKYVALGVALLLLLHVFINLGMNLGKLPVTGIPLPLMSYGGSSISMIMISLGLVQSINTSRKSVDIADNLMLISQSLLVKEK